MTQKYTGISGWRVRDTLCLIKGLPYRQVCLRVALSEVVTVLMISHETVQVGGWLISYLPTPTLGPSSLLYQAFPFGVLWVCCGGDGSREGSYSVDRI